MTSGKDRKFLFDHNNFDLPDLPPEPEVYVEPPPLFTLDELGHVREDAFEKGRAQGLEEARVSREQYLAQLTGRIAEELKFLLGAEEYRAAIYEREVLSLTDAVFTSLFPHFTARESMGEIRSVISDVLLNQAEQSSIIVELPEADAEAIRSYFSNTDIDAEKIAFKASPALGPASCRLSWKDGGAMRDHQAIADEILRTIRQQYMPVSAASAETPPSPPFSQPPALANTAEKYETETESSLTDPTGE